MIGLSNKLVDNSMMSTILSTTRNRVSFDQKIKSKSLNYQKNINNAIKNFDRFCLEKYKVSEKQMIEEYRIATQDQLFDSLQDWINWNVERKHPTNMIRMYFSCVKKYLKYQKIELYSEDVKDNLDFPITETKEGYALTKYEIKQILSHASHLNRLRILAQLSGGMRRGEMLQLRKKHFDTSKKRIMVKIPSSITKRKKARTIFLSREITSKIIELLKTKDDEDLIFSTGKPNAINIGEPYQQAIVRYLKKCNLYKKSETGKSMISSHSLRAYFITRFNRHDPILAKYFAGQGNSKDLAMYDKLTDDEKLSYYMKYESDLLIYDDEKDKKQDEIIEALKYQNDRQQKDYGKLEKRYSDVLDIIEELNLREIKCKN